MVIENPMKVGAVRGTVETFRTTLPELDSSDTSMERNRDTVIVDCCHYSL